MDENNNLYNNESGENNNSYPYVNNNYNDDTYGNNSSYDTNNSYDNMNQNNNYGYGYNNYGYGTREGYNQYKANKSYNGGNNNAGMRFVKKAALLVASAVVFGTIAGATMLGVNYAGTEYFGLDKEEVTIPSVDNIVSGVDVNTSTIAAPAMNVSNVAKTCMPAMVKLTGVIKTSTQSFFGIPQTYESQTSGTGIIVGKNDKELLVLTNAHVVDNVNNLSCIFVDDKTVAAVIKGSRADKDIAVVAISLADIEESTLSSIAIAELGNSDDVQLGQEVVAIGNALGEGQSVTNGVISAMNRSVTVDGYTFEGLFMTNAAINSGNSGGALLNSDGKVIGINFAKTSESGVEGMAYSIPVSSVRELVDTLMNRETRTKVDAASQAYLGIAALDITSNMASVYGYPQGVQIRTVEEGSAAQKAGLGKYDIIVSFDGQTITSMSSLQTIMQYYKAGEKVEVEYYHIEGNQYNLKKVEVELDRRPAK